MFVGVTLLEPKSKVLVPKPGAEYVPTLIDSGSATSGVPVNINNIDVTGTVTEARITIEWN